MEKNIASRDLSDMMVYEGMHVQSSRFHFKQSFARVRKFVDGFYLKVEHLFKRSKRTQSTSRPLEFEESDLANTATALYAISVASVLISFFWLSLLLTT